MCILKQIGNEGGGSWQGHKDISVPYQKESTKGELLCKSLLSRWKVSKSWAVCGTPTDATPVTHQSLLSWEMQEVTSRKLSKKLQFCTGRVGLPEREGRLGRGTLAGSLKTQTRNCWNKEWSWMWKDSRKPGCELHLKVGWSKALIPLLCSFFLFLFLHFLPQSNIFNRFSS